MERIPTPEALKKLARGVLIQGRKTLPRAARGFWSRSLEVVLEPQPQQCGAGVRLSKSRGDDSTMAGETRALQISPRNPPIRFRKTVPTCWIGLELIEGKNRQVRRMTAAIGHPTLRLLRVRIGNFRLGDLPAGQWRILTAKEIKFVFSRTRDKSGRIVGNGDLRIFQLGKDQTDK